jgi:hypothetical protein
MTVSQAAERSRRGPSQTFRGTWYARLISQESPQRRVLRHDMSRPEEFTLHFAQLVWMLVHRPTMVDEQKAALRLALAETRSGDQALVLTELNRAVAEAARLTPVPMELPWMSELGMRMAGHSVSRFDFSENARAADVLGIARALATHSVHGDDGASFDARVVALAPVTVSMRLGRSGFVRHGTPVAPMRGIGAPPARTPSLGVAIYEQGIGDDLYASRAFRTPTPLPQKAFDADATERASARVAGDPVVEGEMVEAAFTKSPSGVGIEHLYARLDAIVTVETDPRLLDDLTRVIEDFARDGLWVGVAEGMSRMMARDAIVVDPDSKRAFLIHFRRLCKPGILRGIAQLLPRRRELRQSVQQILTRSGEPGADVLIDLMVSSDHSTERRAYRTAIAQCPCAGTALTHLLADQRWYVVRNAAELLGEMQVMEADNRLTAVLRHSDARVRRSAAASLGRLGTTRAVHALQHAMEDPSSSVRLQAVLGLSAARNARSVGPLLAALDVEEDVAVQHAILAALGNHPTPEAVDRLTQAARSGGLLNRRPLANRLEAIEALAAAGTHDALAALRGLLSDKDRDVRSTVERLLVSRSHEPSDFRRAGAARR